MVKVQDAPLLTKEEERELIKRYQEDKDKEAKDRLVLSNLGLVRKAVSYFLPITSIESDDLFEEGVMGLMHSIDLFDLNYDVKFSTYSMSWIKQYIRRYITNMDKQIRIPAHMQESIYKINQFIVNYKNKHGYPPDDKEIQKALGCSDQKIAFYNSYKKTVSLNSRISEESEDELIDMVPDKTAPIDEKITKKIINTNVREIMSNILTDKEEYIIKMRFGIGDAVYPHTLQELADEMGLTRERIRQIEKKALLKLRHNRKFRQLNYS